MAAILYFTPVLLFRIASKNIFLAMSSFSPGVGGEEEWYVGARTISLFFRSSMYNKYKYTVYI